MTAEQSKTLVCPQCGNTNPYTAGECLRCGLPLEPIRKALAEATITPREELRSGPAPPEAHEAVSELVIEFLETPDSEKETFMIRHKRELLSDAADAALMSIISSLPEAKRARANVFREVLRQANSVGVQQAWAEYRQREQQMVKKLIAFIEAPTLATSQRMLSPGSDLLTDLSFATLDKLITGAQLQGEQRDTMVFAQHFILLIRCREFGVDYAFDEIKSGRDDYWMLQKR